MSKYNEYIKAILTEVESFLVESIKSVALSKSAEKQKQSILDKLDVLRVEYPNLLPAKPGPVNPKTTTDDDSGNTGSSLEDGEESAYSENIANLSAGEALAGCTRSGMLLKKRKAGDLRSKLNPFQKRWCIIKHNIFYYYEKSSDKQQKGAFSLAGYQFREAPYLVKEANKKDLSFQLYCLGNRTYEFLAASKQDMEEWKQAVESSIKEKANTTPPAVQDTSSHMEDHDEIYEPIEDHIIEPSSSPSTGYEPSSDDSFRPSSIYEEAVGNTTSTPIKPPEIVPRDRRPPPAEPKRDLPDSKNWKIGVANDYMNMYYGKWDCKADADNELAFKQGDIIHVLSKEYDAKSWWIAELKGNIGLVPKKYLVEAYERVTD